MKYYNCLLVATLLLRSVAFASDLSCTPAPCTTPNVRITPISTIFAAVEFSAAATLHNSAVVVSSNYYKSGLNCSTSTRSGVWISSDPGAIAFSGGCLSPPTNDRYCCDPVSAAYSDSTGIGNKYYTGFIANDSAATLCGYCDVLLRSSTNGGRSWSSPFGSLEALDYDLSDTQRVHHRVYLEDFGHMIVDSTGGTYDGCGYVAAMNFEINDAEHV